LTSFLLASHPRSVRDALDQHRGLDDNPVQYLKENVARHETALRLAADDFAAQPDGFAIANSTTSVGVSTPA
jgi:hypothetical protein